MEKFDKETAKKLTKTLGDIMRINEVLYSIMSELDFDKRRLRCIKRTVDICRATIFQLFILCNKYEND